MRYGLINFLILFLLPVSLFAQYDECDCPQHPGKINKEIVEDFDLIFRGKIISIEQCKNKEKRVLFYGEELFKGERIPREIPLLISCEKACSFQFELEEEWLIYAREDSTLPYFWRAELCERSRKIPIPGKEDPHILYNDMRYDEERAYLIKNVHPKPIFIENEDLKIIEQEGLKVIDANRDITLNHVPTKIILLAISLVFMLGLIFFMKKWMK